MAARELDAWAEEWGRGQADNSIRCSAALRVIADRLETMLARAMKDAEERQKKYGPMAEPYLNALLAVDADIPATPPPPPRGPMMKGRE